MPEDSHDIAEFTNALLEAHFSNQGLKHLVREAFFWIQKPIVVVDASYHYVAHELGELKGSGTRLSEVMCSEIESENVLEEAVTYIRDSQIDSKLARLKTPLETYNEILECNTLTIAVKLSGICIAHVMMMEDGRPFTDFDREAITVMGKFVGQEMQKSDAWSGAKGEMSGYFLETLLNAKTPSMAATERRMRALNYQPKDVFYVVCLHAADQGLGPVEAERVASQLKPMLHHSLYTRHHQQLVLLVSRDEGVGFAPSAEQRLREVAMLNDLTVGVSNLYTLIVETRGYYEQARSAVRYGTTVRHGIDDGRLFRFSDYAHLYMFGIVGRHASLITFVHPALLRLLDYDQGHNSEFMETLYCYLQLAGSTAKAAKVLSLHKNTLLYRLGRIRRVLDMDLSSGENLFMLQFGIRILISLGLFTPKVTLSRSELSG